MKTILAIILLLPLFVSGSCAEELTEAAAAMSGIEELQNTLPDDVKYITGHLEQNGTYNGAGALRRLFDDFADRLYAEINRNIKAFLSLVIISLFCSLGASLCKDKISAEYISIAGVCAVAMMFLSNVDGMIGETVEALHEISGYSKAAFPAIFTAAAAGGALVSSSARYAAVSLGLDVIMNTAQTLIIPLVYAFLALSLSKGLFDNPLIRTVQHFIKWLVGILLTALTLVFSAYINITGAISANADALAVKTARTVISNTLPVVGGMISDAASTVLSAANMIKSSAGALSLVAVCALCISPFAMISVKMLVFRLSASLCDMVPCSKVSGFINDIGTALSILLGLLGCVSIMLFISFMSVIKVVTG